jgi:hypothetical protein
VPRRCCESCFAEAQDAQWSAAALGSAERPVARIAVVAAAAGAASSIIVNSASRLRNWATVGR